MTRHRGVVHPNSVDTPYVFGGHPPARPRETITIQLFTFPENASLVTRKLRAIYVPLLSLPIPTIVNSVGFAVGILQSTNVIRGIYNQERGRQRRVKVDTLTNAVSPMNQMEIVRYPTDCVFYNPGSIVSFVPENYHYPREYN